MRWGGLRESDNVEDARGIGGRGIAVGGGGIGILILALAVYLCGGDPHPLPDQVVRIADALDDVPPVVDLAPDTSQTPIMFHSDPHPLADALRIPLPRSFKEGVQAYAREAGWLPADIAG